MNQPYFSFTDEQKNQLRSGLVGEELATLDKLLTSPEFFYTDPNGVKVATEIADYYNNRFSGKTWDQLGQTVGGLLNQDLTTLSPAQKLDLASYYTSHAQNDRNWAPKFKIPDVEQLFAQKWGGELKPSRPVDYNAQVRGNEFNSEVLAKITPLLLNPSVFDVNTRSLNPFTSYGANAPQYQQKYADTPSLASYHSGQNKAIDWNKVVESAFGQNPQTGPVNFGAARIGGRDEQGNPIYTPWSRDDVVSWVWGVLGDDKIIENIRRSAAPGGAEKDIRRYFDSLDNLAKDIWAEQQERSKLFGPNDLRSVVPLGTDKRYLDPYTFDPTRGDWVNQWGKQAFVGLAAALTGYGAGQAAGGLLASGAGGGGGTAGGGAGSLASQATGPLAGGNIGTGTGAAVIGGSGGGGVAGGVGGALGGTTSQIPTMVVTGTVGGGSSVGGALGGALGGLAGNTGAIKIPDQKPGIDKALEKKPGVEYPQTAWDKLKGYADKAYDAYDTYNKVTGAIGNLLGPEAVSGGLVSTGGGGGGGSSGPPLAYDPSIMAMILRNVQTQTEAARPRLRATQTEKVK